MSNTYSTKWFTTFLGTIDAEVVERELAFLERQLPLPEFSRILDLCSGPGRHAAPLSARGYDVIALDRDAAALGAAGDRARNGGLSMIGLVRGDMMALPVHDRALDAVICMWQSFGQFDESGNRAALAGVRDALRPGGRLVLDVYNRLYHERHLGCRTIERGDQRVLEQRELAQGRLRVRLSYENSASDAAGDEFEWRLYDAPELAAIARGLGLRPLGACSGFDEGRPVTAEEPRMQLTFSREEGGGGFP